MIWADTLDWPLIDFLGCAWARDDTENAVEHGNPADGFSGRFYGRGGIRPLFAPHHRGSGEGNSPMFLYSRDDIRGALDDLAGFDGDPHEGIIVELVNPEKRRAGVHHDLIPRASSCARARRPNRSATPRRRSTG